MATLFTEVEIPKPNFSIDYQSSLFFIGSCFSSSIGEKFRGASFLTEINPVGTLYNPSSIVSALQMLETCQKQHEHNLFCDGDLWGNLNFSTLFSSNNKEEALRKMNGAIDKGAQWLKSSNVIFITLGTSWVYRHKDSGNVVASCHKLPSRDFTRELLTFSRSVELFSSILSRPMYRDKQIVLTVSPVRHLKDGFEQNTVSKSHLVLCCNELCAKFSNVSYLPIYEIFMDELRDYRFYGNDLVHPSPFAVDIVWEKVQRWFFDTTTLKIKKEIEQIALDVSHKPKYPQSEAYVLFQKRLKHKIESVEARLRRKLSFL